MIIKIEVETDRYGIIVDKRALQDVLNEIVFITSRSITNKEFIGMMGIALDFPGCWTEGE